MLHTGPFIGRIGRHALRTCSRAMATLKPGDPGFVRPAIIADQWEEFGPLHGVCRMSGTGSVREVASGHIAAAEVLARHQARYGFLKESYPVLQDDKPILPPPDVASRRGAGFIVTLKDAVKLSTIPYASRQGSLLEDENPSDGLRPLVQQLLSHSVTVIGQSASSEYGLTGTGSNAMCDPFCNPFCPELTTGGSSGAGAAAVALHIAHASLGRDLAGSVRMPASFCGCVGVRPRSDLVVAGHYTKDETNASLFGRGLMSVGPIARNVADAALVMDILLDSTSCSDACVSSPVEQPLSIAVLSRTKHYTPEPVVSKSFAAAATRLAHCAKVQPISDADDVITDADMSPQFLEYWLRRLSKLMRDKTNFSSPELVNKVSSDVRDLWAEAERLYPNIVEHRETELFNQVRRHTVISEWMRKHAEIDALVMPTLGILPWSYKQTAPRGNDGNFVADWLSFVFPMNFADMTCGTLPCGWHAADQGHVLPIGMQVVVRKAADPKTDLMLLFKVMHRIETCFAHLQRHHRFPHFVFPARPPTSA